MTMQIDEELVCIEALDNFLRENFKYENINIQREDDDPPDFWITIEGKKFAAEITSINIEADIGYFMRCNRLKDEISRVCKENDCLKGMYALIIQGHPELPRRKNFKKLIDQVSSCIKSAKNDTLLKDRNGYIAIQKLAENGSTLGMVGPTGTKWEGNVREELSQLIQSAIDNKIEKLSNKGVPEECPDAIILFYEAYGYCDPIDVKESFKDVKRFDWFHSVFWVESFSDRQNKLFPNEPGRSGFFLHSNKQEWKIQR